MRRIITFNNVSADGYFADVNGGLDQFVSDPELSQAVMKNNEEIDTVLFGRITYQQFEGFWPNAAKDPSTPADLRGFADLLTDMQKFVFSRTLKKVGWKNAKILPKLVASEVEAMKRGNGGDMIIFGSGSIAEQLTDHGLIDEYQFVVNPVLFGSGRSLLEDAKVRTRLNLVEARPFRSGNVVLRYEKATRPGPQAAHPGRPSKR